MCKPELILKEVHGILDVFCPASVQNKIGHKVKETRWQPGLPAILTGSTCTMGLFLGQLVRNFVIANEKSDSVFQDSPIMQFGRATSKWPIL